MQRLYIICVNMVFDGPFVVVCDFYSANYPGEDSHMKGIWAWPKPFLTPKRVNKTN